MRLRYRHAGSAMGPFWLFLSPLLQVAVYAIVFSKIMEARIEAPAGMTFSFTLYLCAGLMPWQAFSEQISRSQSLILRHAADILDTALPEDLILLREALESYILSLLYILLVLALSLLMGGSPNASWLLLPAITFLLTMFALGLGAIASVLLVLVRDLGPMIEVGLRLWFWATPIVYVVSILPDWMQDVVRWNPMLPYIEAIRNTVLYGHSPAGVDWLAMSSIALACVLAGFSFLRYLRDDFRDVL